MKKIILMLLIAAGLLQPVMAEEEKTTVYLGDSRKKGLYLIALSSTKCYLNIRLPGGGTATQSIVLEKEQEVEYIHNLFFPEIIKATCFKDSVTLEVIKKK